MCCPETRICRTYTPFRNICGFFRFRRIFEGGDYIAPAGTYAKENDFVPVNKALSMSPAEFFNTANALMQINPPAEADAKLLEKLAAINVGQGMTFDASILGADAAERWTQMLKGLRATLSAESTNYTQNLGQWIYFGRPIGDFGTAYTYRAMVALVGLGANTVDVAIYPKTHTDVTGAALTGEKTYTIHFETLPPTLEGGFWSVTAYNERQLSCIDNPIDRYCINDRSAYRRMRTVRWISSCRRISTGGSLQLAAGFRRRIPLFMRIYRRI